MRSLVLTLVLTLTACASDGQETPDAPPADGVSAEAPCDLLPPADAAAALGVAEGDLERIDATHTCTYATENGMRAAVERIEVFETAAEAEQAFTSRYRTLTDDEAAAATAAIRDQVERQREAGDLDDETADGASAMAGGLVGRATESQYAPVADVGDQALYDGTIRKTPMMTTATSKLHVRSGNLIFTAAGKVFVHASRDDVPEADDVARNRDAAVAVARAVLANAR